MKVFWMMIVLVFEGLWEFIVRITKPFLSLIGRAVKGFFSITGYYIYKFKIPLVIGLSIGALAYSHFHHVSNTEDIAKAELFVKNGYPTLECTASSGGKRIYEEGTYTVGETFLNGYNVWWKDRGNDHTTAFHVAKCEIKG